jgi:cytochrome c peroxidase
VLVVLWNTLPGLPVMWGPRASAEMKAAGQAIFEHDWTVNDPLAGGDGLGPVFNATSCLACHFQGGVGGGGPNRHNVRAFEVLPSRRNPHLQSGLIHHFAVAPAYQETQDAARRLFPIETGTQKVVVGCTVTVPDFDPLRVESINTSALFGAGWIDRISSRTITHNRLRKGLAKMAREFELDFRTVPPGRTRILPDGRVGKFGWRGQFATLEEFVAAACANELGLGNPLMEQPRPLGRSDYPASKPDLDGEQFAALVAFVDTLPRPIELVPERASERAAAERGKKLFHTVGCAICHVPDLGGVEGIYSDLLLYQLEDRSAPGSGSGYGNQAPPIPLPDGHPRPDEWKTPPLWGVADSAPYFHDGGSPTLEAAILRHRGDAETVSRAYKALPAADQQAVIAFLKTLKAPPDAPAAQRPQVSVRR